MKKFKHILILLLLIATTLVINGGTKLKPCVKKTRTKELTETTPLHGFPDLITFTNYVNQ